MSYEVKDESGIHGPFTVEQLTETLLSGEGPMCVRVAGTHTWHDPGHYAELRRSLPTQRPPVPIGTGLVPVAPLKTVAWVRSPTAAPRLRTAGRDRRR